MSKNLSTGANIMRYFQIAAFFMAIGGAVWSGYTLSGTPSPELQSFATTSLVIFLLITIAIASSIWLLARRKLAKRINLLSDLLRQVTAGNLTVRIEASSEDELDQLGRNVNLMLDRFETLIISINEIVSTLTGVVKQSSEAASTVLSAANVQSTGVEQTTSAINGIISSVDKVSERVINLSGSADINSASINEISSSIADVKNSVAIQSESIDEVSSSIIEMSAVMDQITVHVNSLMEASANTTSSVAEMDASNKQVEQNAAETASISSEVLDDARQGRSAVAATIGGIDQIRDSSRITFESITKLSERVAAIGSILSVIDEVAEQTNLLALNSAIIAAQAGEHGKGFAIVAGEIKGLATRTRQSTMEISSLIEGVQEETAKAVKAIRQTEEKVLEGEHLSKRSGDALDKVVSGVQMAANRVNEIARATLEQAQGGQYIHNAMRHVADMVAQIAKSCQESAITHKSIMFAVERMKGLTSTVNNSAANQQQIGSDIAMSTRKMSADIDNIKEACEEQSQWSLQIYNSLDSVTASTQSNLDAAMKMEQGVEKLLTQIELLKTEIKQLQISDRKA